MRKSVVYNQSRAFGKKNGGYSLLFAVLIGSMLIAIGAGMANLTLKELNLVSTARESQNAFYAADAGAECALYADLQQGLFKEPFDYNDSAVSNLQCNGQTLSLLFTPVRGFGNDSRVDNAFSFDFNGSCVSVSVAKIDVNDDTLPSPLGWNGRVNGVLLFPEPDGYRVRTIIEARGRNVSCGGQKPIQVERAIKVEY